jgi:hypothetical protein
MLGSFLPKLPEAGRKFCELFVGGEIAEDLESNRVTKSISFSKKTRPFPFHLKQKLKNISSLLFGLK